jgi:hypothetical protein
LKKLPVFAKKLFFDAFLVEDFLACISSFEGSKHAINVVENCATNNDPEKII